MTICDSLLLSSSNKIIDPDNFDLAGSVVGILTENLAAIALHSVNEVLVFVKFFCDFVKLKIFLLKLLLKLVSHFDFDAPPLFLQFKFKFFLIFLQIVYLLLQHFDMQLQLLFYFNMVTYVVFVHLQLSFVLFWRQIERLESGRKIRSIAAVYVTIPSVVESERAAAISWVPLVVSFQIHQDFDRSSYVINHCQTVKLHKSISFFLQHVLLKCVNLICNQFLPRHCCGSLLADKAV